MDEIKSKSKRGGSRPNAGRKKGQSRTAQQIAHQVAEGEKPVYVRADRAIGVQREFAKILDEKGATDGKLAQRIAEGLDAQETEFAKFEGKITDSVDVVSWSERRAYAELICKIKRVIQTEAPPPSAPDIRVNIIHVGDGSLNVGR